MDVIALGSSLGSLGASQGGRPRDQQFVDVQAGTSVVHNLFISYFNCRLRHTLCFY